MSLSHSQIAELRVAFDSIDSDHDKKLGKAELQKLMEKLNMKVEGKVIDKMFKIADKDGSGFIDFDEFVEAMSAAIQPASKNEILATFKAMDKDGSGTLSFNEVKSALKSCGQAMCDSDIKEMIKQADKDRDGQVSYKEFVEMMK